MIKKHNEFKYGDYLIIQGAEYKNVDTCDCESCYSNLEGYRFIGIDSQFNLMFVSAGTPLVYYIPNLRDNEIQKEIVKLRDNFLDLVFNSNGFVNTLKEIKQIPGILKIRGAGKNDFYLKNDLTTSQNTVLHNGSRYWNCDDMFHIHIPNRLFDCYAWSRANGVRVVLIIDKKSLFDDCSFQKHETYNEAWRLVI